MAGKAAVRYEEEEERKDVPLGIVIIAGVVIWVIIFGSVFAYTYMAPCSFIKTVVGGDTFLKFKDPRLRTPPCEPKTDLSCTAWKLDTTHDCLCFLGLRPIGGDCLDYLD